MLPDPRIYILLAVVIGSFAGGWMVHGWKTDAEVLAVEETRKAALQGAAEAIAKIKVENRTIYAKVQTEIVEKPVYRECVHDPKTLEAVNEALSQ